MPVPLRHLQQRVHLITSGILRAAGRKGRRSERLPSWRCLVAERLTANLVAPAQDPRVTLVEHYNFSLLHLKKWGIYNKSRRDFVWYFFPLCLFGGISFDFALGYLANPSSCSLASKERKIQFITFGSSLLPRRET